MIRTHPLTPAAATLIACAAVTLAVALAVPALPLAALAAVAWVMLGVAAGYSISGSP
jgi:hypothetical protein